MADSNAQKITYFAETNFRNKRVKFGIKGDDRRRHIYVIGKTGMGKSTILENMFMDDVYAGNGACFVDPHGDTVERFLNYIPASRINDVIYFNPSDIEYPIAFNILENVDPSLQHIVASGLLGVFKKLWADSWGPRLEYVLRNAILALLDYPGSTLLGVLRLLTDKEYRKKVVEKIRDPVVKAFWVDEYEKYPDKFKVEAIAPIQNKVGQFLANFLIRNIVGQVKSTIDMREVMDNGKLLLLNLSKGRIGEDTSALLGAMIITKIQLAAMSRVDTIEDKRKDFYLYVDEFQNFATESFATILSEARKYHLCLTIAHQYIEQLDEKVAAAVFGNVGTLMAFRVGAADAEFLVKEFEPVFTEQDIVNLTKYDMYLKLMIDGVASEPFSAHGLAPFVTHRPLTNNVEKVIRVSRERYAKSRSIVEDKIIRWSAGVKPDVVIAQGKNYNKGGSQGYGQNSYQQNQGFVKNYTPNQGNRNFDNGGYRPKDTENNFKNMDTPNSNNQPQGVPPKNTTDGASQYLQYVAKQQAQKGLDMEREVVLRDTDAAAPNRQNATQCWSCNKLTYVSFVPDGKRPVYCKNCLHDMRMKKAEMQGDAPDASPNSYTPKPALAFKPKSSFVITPKSEIQKPQQVTPPALPKVTKSQVPEAPSKNVEPKPQEVQEISLKKLTPGQVVKFHQKS